MPRKPKPHQPDELAREVEYTAHGLAKVPELPGAFDREGSWKQGGKPHASAQGFLAYLREKRNHRWFGPNQAAEIIRASQHAEMFGIPTLNDWARPDWNNGGWDWPYVHCGTSAAESIKRATEWAWTELAPLRPGLAGPRLADTLAYLATLGVHEPGAKPHADPASIRDRNLARAREANYDRPGPKLSQAELDLLGEAQRIGEMRKGLYDAERGDSTDPKTGG